MSNFGEINLLENQIQDPNAQENFRRIKGFLRDESLLKTGFFFRTFSIPASGLVDFRFAHNLTFIPKDVLVSSILNDATVTWHYEKFDRTYVYLTASAATTLRVFFGAYKDDNS